MATCGRLQHIFEKKKLLPETPTFLDSLSSSWNQNSINRSSPIDDNHSFTEIFGELHFKESSSSFECQIDDKATAKEKLCGQSDYAPTKQFIMSSSESLQLCTEGLGSESSDDVEEMKTDDVWINQEETRKEGRNREYKMRSRSRSIGGGQGFPPPISSIGKSGKPGVCFRSFRCDGRFVLKEVRIPSQEFIHAQREDGRLRLQLFRSDDETEAGEMAEEEEEEDHEEITD